MGLEYRNFIKLAGKAELKKRLNTLKDLPKNEDGAYLPHDALAAKDVKSHDSVTLYFPHNKETEVRFIDASVKDGPLVVRHVVEKTAQNCEKYGPEIESENVEDMVELLRDIGNPIPSRLTTVKVREFALKSTPLAERFPRPATLVRTRRLCIM